MRSPVRVLAASTLAVALLVAVAAMDGCGTADCNDTATCPVSDDRSSSQPALDATGEVVNGGDALDDAGEGGANATDAVDDTSDVAVIPGDAPGEANDASDAGDATVDVDMSDSPPEGGPLDATDVAVEAPVDAGPMCHSNLLVAKTASASSTNGTNLAADAIDADFTTRWESAHNVDPQWIYLDFGSRVFVDRVRILWEIACAVNYDIQTSNDATNWTTMQSITGNMLSQRAPTNWNGAADHTGLVGFGRYVRINGTVRCGMLATYGYSIWEMQVYGDTNAMCHP